MSYSPRTKDDPGDPGRAADQQQSVDNEDALYASLLGPAESAWPPGIIKQFVKKSSIADNTATEVFTITTTTGEVGSYTAVIEGVAVHGEGPTGEASIMGGQYIFSRGVNATPVGVNSAVVEGFETAVGASVAATKTISTVTFTVVETSELVQAVKVTIDLAGTTITTGRWFGMVTLYFSGFSTPPYITSAE